MEKEQQMKQLVSTITDAVNKYGFDQDLFNQLMSNEHRTLQQSFTRMVLGWIEHAADSEYRTDGRNLQTHVICKSLVDLHNKAILDSGMKPSDLKYFKLSKTLPTI